MTKLPNPHKRAKENARPHKAREHSKHPTELDQRRRHVEALLDAALEDTFPASDAVAIRDDRGDDR